MWINRKELDCMRKAEDQAIVNIYLINNRVVELETKMKAATTCLECLGTMDDDTQDKIAELQKELNTRMSLRIDTAMKTINAFKDLCTHLGLEYNWTERTIVATDKQKPSKKAQK